jgi:hypothetical protein
MPDALLQDLRYALRALRSTPIFASVAILSLALGIGATTAIFSLINSLILKSLPVSHPEQLLQVTRGKDDYYTNPIWEQLRDRQDVFSACSPTAAIASTWLPEAKLVTRTSVSSPASSSTLSACVQFMAVP